MTGSLDNTLVGMTAWSPGRRIADYDLIKVIAKGGMGEVWLATQRAGKHGPARQVALKRLVNTAGADDDAVAALRDEASILMQLHHPNIVEVWDLKSDGLTWYLAMEFLEGYNFDHIIRRTKRLKQSLPMPLAVEIVAQAALGLGYAHRYVMRDGRPMRLVHRDISPHNIFVTTTGRVKVIDFGIARAVERETSTQMGIVKGKLAYMAFEQARGEPVDARADVFSLGVVLLESLSGARAWGNLDDGGILRQIIARANLPDVAAIAPHVPDELADIVRMAICAKPDGRFLDGQEFADALLAWLAPAPSDVLLKDYVASLFAIPTDEGDGNTDAVTETLEITAAGDARSNSGWNDITPLEDDTPIG